MKIGVIYSKCAKNILLIYAPLYSGFYESRRRRQEGASVSSEEAFGAARHARAEKTTPSADSESSPTAAMRPQGALVLLLSPALPPHSP